MGLAGALMVLFAAPVSTLLTSEQTLASWVEVVGLTMSNEPGVWRAMRAVLRYGAIPMLFAALALLLVVSYRRSPRAAAALALISLLGNLTTQVVKRVALDGDVWGVLNPLSGHVALAAGIMLGWLVVVPASRRAAASLAAVVVIGAVGIGNVLAGWHTPFQVLCPILICLGWSLIGMAALGQDPMTEGTASQVRRRVAGCVLVGLSVLALAPIVAELRTISPTMAEHPLKAVGLAVLGVVLAAGAAVGCVLVAASSTWSQPVAEDRSRLDARTEPSQQTT